MRQKTSFFNRALFLKNSARFWPLWAMYLVMWLLTGPLVLSSSLSWNRSSPMSVVVSFLQSASGYGVVMLFITGAVFALAVFSYLYSSKSANMMASLPLTRGTVYCTSYLTGLIWMIGAHVIVFLCTILVLSAHGVLDMRILLTWLGIVSLEGVFFYSFACFCAMLTGNGFVMPLVYAVLNFAVVIYELLVRGVLSTLLFGASGTVGEIALDKFAPAVAMIEERAGLLDPNTHQILYPWDKLPADYSVFYGGRGLLITYAAVGIVFALLGLALYRRRRMESASDVVSVKALKPVFKYCMGIGGALCACLLFYYMFFNDNVGGGSKWIYMIVCAIPGAFIGWYAAEMLVRKSFKVFRHWQGFVRCAVLVCTFIFCADADVLGYEKRVPDAGDVESVSVSAHVDALLKEPGNIEKVIELHKSIIENKELYEDGRIGLRQTPADDYYNVHTIIHYELADGSSLERAYDLFVNQESLSDPNSDIMTLQNIQNSKEAIGSRYGMDYELSRVFDAEVYYYDETVGDLDRRLEVEEARQLFQAVKKDVEAGAIGLVEYSFYSDAPYEEPFSCSVNIGIAGDENNAAARYVENGTARAEAVDYIYVQVNEQSENTLAYLRDELNMIPAEVPVSASPAN